MINIKKSTNARRVPGSLRSADVANSLSEIYNDGSPDKDRIKRSIYAFSDVREKLGNLYHNKCAYCETKDPDFEVEHYRPKKQIHSDDLSGQEHPGYYWLSYEWTNLLPACHDCNKRGVKGNRFPIAGIRQTSPILREGVIDANELNAHTSQELLAEEALLLHPEQVNFDPFNYFKMNSNGEVLPRGGNGTLRKRKAQSTIDTVCLNREKLKLIFRKASINRLVQHIKGIYLNYLKDYINQGEERALERFKSDYFAILDQIVSNARPTEKYSFFWAYLYRNMDRVVVAKALKPKYRTILIRLTEEHKSL